MLRGKQTLDPNRSPGARSMWSAAGSKVGGEELERGGRFPQWKPSHTMRKQMLDPKKQRHDWHVPVAGPERAAVSRIRVKRRKVCAGRRLLTPRSERTLDPIS